MSTSVKFASLFSLTRNVLNSQTRLVNYTKHYTNCYFTCKHGYGYQFPASRRVHTTTPDWLQRSVIHCDNINDEQDPIRSENNIRDFSDSYTQESSVRERNKPYNESEPPKPSNTVFVNNLPYHVTSPVLKDEFPGALSVRIPVDRMTQRSKGFAFIEFNTEEEASAAIWNKNEAFYEGRTIFCRYATQNYDRRPQERFTPRVQEEETEYSPESGKDIDDLRMKHRAQTGTQHRNGTGLSFSDFPLTSQLQQTLSSLGYESPFEIQTKTLTSALEGCDIIAKSVTGSGKTLAFSIPIVQKIQSSFKTRNRQNPSAIVISPTRELCLQIHRSIQELDPRVKCVALYGGASIRNQRSAMKYGVDVICATPGRLADMYQNGAFSLESLEFLCLDEADELLTPNFKDQIEDILDDSPSNKQMFLFSATMPPNVNQLTRKYMSDPVTVDITDSQQYKAPESVTHMCMQVRKAKQFEAIKGIIEQQKPDRCIVFCDTKVATSRLALYLRNNHNIRAESINSDLTQSRREVIMDAFRTGKIHILCATDVAARGIDIPEIDLIVQNPPQNGTEYYIHRSGRTGRAGREGTSIILYDLDIERDCETMAEISEIIPLDFLNGSEEDLLRYKHRKRNTHDRYRRKTHHTGKRQWNKPTRRREWWDD